MTRLGMLNSILVYRSITVQQIFSITGGRSSVAFSRFADAVGDGDVYI